MGWFTGSTKTYVSSVVYNLAGDISKRPDYLKTTVVGAVMADQDVADSLSSAYIQGPGIKLRNFARWARTGTYSNDLGLQTGTIVSGHNIDLAVLQAQIPAASGVSVSVQSVQISNADFTFWADQYVAAHRPDQLSIAYQIAYDLVSNTITITYGDGTTASFTADGYVSSGSYLYATYVQAPGAITPLVFIYQKGSGNPTLDAMWAAPADLGSFFPFIPFRVNNQKLSDLYPDTLYPECVTAVKKALNAKYSDIETKIESNSSIGDIDYAYAMFGCCLNTQENASKKYIYKFFQTILEEPSLSESSDYSTFESSWLAAKASWDAWTTWYNAGQAGTEPVRQSFPAMLTNSVNVGSTPGSAMNFNMSIQWNYMYEETGTGLLKPDAKSHELWIEAATVPVYGEPVWSLDPDTGVYVVTGDGTTMQSGITLNWQIDTDNWRRITAVGLKHRNLIYNGMAVEITAEDALVDPDESGFIVPLHEDIYKSLSITDYTQMATACCYLVFNCYTVVKSKWYQTGWFQILLIVAVVVISVLTLGAGAVGASAGLLGTNAAVGGAILGTAASATMIAIVGAVVNAIAAAILVALINKGAVAVFGDRLGTLIGAIVSFVSLQFANGIEQGQSLATAFKDLMSPLNLVNLTNSVGNGIAAYVKGGVQNIMEEIDKVQKQFSSQMESINNKAVAEFGYGAGAVIDPLQFTDSLATTAVTMEPADVFLNRTLMTGSDIADLSMSMLHNFTDLTLNLALA